MNIIVCVASVNPDRLKGFMLSVGKSAYSVVDPIKLLVIENYVPSVKQDALTWNGFRSDETFWKIGTPEKRPYAEIVKEKVAFVSEHATDDSIVWFADDDYACNYYALAVMKTVFEENPKVDYASLLRGPNVPNGDLTLSGWQFLRWGSCMGGCTMVRWSTFKKHAKGFFDRHGTDNFFDQLFWSYLWQEFGLGSQVYMMTNPCSLVQHCNLGSAYGHDQGTHGHMHSVNFDPRANPFSLRIKP